MCPSCAEFFPDSVNILFKLWLCYSSQGHIKPRSLMWPKWLDVSKWLRHSGSDINVDEKKYIYRALSYERLKVAQGAAQDSTLVFQLKQLTQIVQVNIQSRP